MESSINKRFAEIISYSGKSITQCAKELGISQPTLRACVNGDNKPSYDVIEKTLIGFPMISSEWLMRGNGKMVKEEKPIIEATNQDSVSMREYFEQTNKLTTQITNLIEQNSKLTEQNSKLTDTIANQQEMILSLQTENRKMAARMAIAEGAAGGAQAV
jgi:plasmid maintenance system antidote protein VapI